MKITDRRFRDIDARRIRKGDVVEIVNVGNAPPEHQELIGKTYHVMGFVEEFPFFKGKPAVMIEGGIYCRPYAVRVTRGKDALGWEALEAATGWLPIGATKRKPSRLPRLIGRLLGRRE